ncbi:MAG: hypothetical protein GXO80_02525 [Chlorobi bacterium]|nr:hypothetical protein [Chlorobiota bacterium]
MLIEFSNWKSRMYKWAEINSGKCKIIKHISVGSIGDSFTLEITIKSNLAPIKVMQNGGGTNFEVGLSYLMFEQNDKSVFNFKLSLYRKDFFDKLFGKNKPKTGNKDFDKVFGIYTDDKKTASAIFKDTKISNLFLNNPFLVLNIQKNKSLLTFKSMKRKLYKTEELQELLNNFRYISELITEIKHN